MGTFTKYAVSPQSPYWGKLIERPNILYSRDDDIRSPFARHNNSEN